MRDSIILMRRFAAILAPALLFSACGLDSFTYKCKTNAQCGGEGVCVDGSCAFPSTDCATGYQFDKSAKQAGQCAPAPVSAPAGLAYSTNPAMYTKGQAITPNTPSSTGGAVDSYSIDPALPSGLALNTTTGIISGTPAELSPTRTYKVTAMNAAGMTTAQLSLTVRDDVPPAGLTYSTNPAVYTLGQAIADNVPSSTGGAVASYAITPTLPFGLSFDTTTGVISGIPTQLSPMTTYTVTGTNPRGMISVELVITVNDVPPSALTYSTNPAVYTVGLAIANNTPSSSGGPVVSYAVSPALPAGLSLDMATGIITGTPTVLAPTADYTVTATNSGGSATATLTITVNDVPPSSLTYSTNPAVYVNGQAIAGNTPSSTGGAVVSYSVSPALPAGLSLDTATGIISGTPTVVSATADYVVTATNSGGSTMVTLTITVNDVAPSGLSYSTNPVVYSKGQAITNNTPSSSGGAVISYSISPPLPTGLNLDTITGAISGTPTVLSATTSYTVTAMNSGGMTSATLSITIIGGFVMGTQGALTAGNNHSCAVVNGGVQCWGAGGSGQLGNNSSSDSSVPVWVQGLSTAVQAVAAGAGADYTCALVHGGVQCWGVGTSGQLGNNSTNSSPVPVQVQGLTNGVQAVAAGGSHACALVNGGVRCWGANGSGQLGNNSGGTSPISVQVPGLTSGVQAIAAGTAHTCALVNGGVQCWGAGSNGQLGNNATSESPTPVPVLGFTSGVQAISANGNHSCALSSGNVYCWGENANGQLGNNSTTQSPVPVQVVVPQFAIGVGTGVSHTCNVVNGYIECWGANASGQLGNNSTAESHVYTFVSNLNTGSAASTVVGGTSHTCAMINGAVQCWGLNTNGQLGNNSTIDRTVPVQVFGLNSSMTAVSVGAQHACAVVDGVLQCWGYNSDGELGNNSTTESHIPVTRLVAGKPGHGSVDVSAGDAFTCSASDADATCWGRNFFGQLGNNTTSQSNVGVQVWALNAGVRAVTTGDSHACALFLGGVKCWGINSTGQLGNNTKTESHVPVQVSNLTSGVQAIAAGNSHSCALVNGGIQCWGDNINGELGNNSTTEVDIPVQTLGLTSGAQGIALGQNHSCAVVNGGVKCWGLNSNGQLGNNSFSQSLVPVSVPGLTGVTAVAAGEYHTCALSNGDVYCWGDRVIGDPNPNPLPTQILSGVQAIGGGYAGFCALANGSIQCWGWNNRGQLGNNSTTDSITPVLVGPLIL